MHARSGRLAWLRRAGTLLLGLAAASAALRAEAGPDTPGRPPPVPGALPRPASRRVAPPPAALGTRTGLPGAREAPPAPPVPGPGAGAPGLVSPSLRPPRPEGAPRARPEDLELHVEREGGVIRRFPEADGTAAYVMAGNPRLAGAEHRRADGKTVDALSIKANRIVLWVDERRVPDAARLFAGDAEAGRTAAAPSPLHALFEEAVLGIYAEGAVEVLYGRLAFRAERLYLEPRTYRGLLLEPRLDGRLAGVGSKPGGIPAFVSGRRARLVAKGLLVFDEAEVSTSRADDRIAIHVRRLTVEEYAQEETAALGPAPALLGFQSLSTQRYRADDVRLRGERLNLVRVPYAAFGGEDQEPFPVTIKRLDAGSRSSLGYYGIVGVGGALGPDERPWGEWVVDVGAYTKRGAALGLGLSYGRPDEATWARLQSRGVFPDLGEDRSGFDADDGVRGRVVFEGRRREGTDWVFDGELGAFTDRGYNREFFERDDLTHKDRETYARALYRPGTVAASLTAGAHLRDFATETVDQPEAGLWVEGVPLVTPGALGGLGIDLTSVTRAGHLGRRFDLSLGRTAYEALRVDNDTRVNLGVDVGDVRFAGWVGGAATSYGGRTDGGEDLTRTALLAGVRADVEAHRAFAARGGPFGLDGLRHVLNLDLEAAGRFSDSHAPHEVPFFDEREQEEERSAFTARLRNRLQTRAGPAGGVRDVLDAEAWWRLDTDDVGPYLRHTPWAAGWSLRGEPRADGRLRLASEGLWDADDDLSAATFALGVRPSPRVDLSFAYRYLKDTASAPLLQVAWQWSDKYSLRVTESYNLLNGDNDLVLLFRRHSHDHVTSFGLSLNGAGDIGLELDFRPTIGGEVGATPSAFENEVDLDPTRAFR